MLERVGLADCILKAQRLPIRVANGWLMHLVGENFGGKISGRRISLSRQRLDHCARQTIRPLDDCGRRKLNLPFDADGEGDLITDGGKLLRCDTGRRGL